MTFALLPHVRLTRRSALRRVGLGSIAVGILPVLQACGGEQEPTPQPTQPTATAPPAAATQPPTSTATLPSVAQPGDYVVEMNDQLRFVPDQLTIKVGETVTWTTVGAQPHTSTADTTKALDPAHVNLPPGAEPWDSGLINRGQSWSHAFDVPGEYAYFCIPHEAAGMLATLTIEA